MLLSTADWQMHISKRNIKYERKDGKIYVEKRNEDDIGMHLRM